ncbi:heterochromatin protein 1-like [Sitodiplosis mosellana]|uniref:heterochromatin protein 1-like n=1 Tax=Sitodiplosis mosellana TaxID=263140 RepID=UPI00244374AC|nr:heterochromatin protein 1-like [Sitodiplosis mosellana]
MKRGRKPKLIVFKLSSIKQKRKSQYPDSVSYVPEQIIEKHKNEALYRVRWPSTWEQEKNLLECKALDLFLNGNTENEDGNDDDDTEVVSEHQSQVDEEVWEVHKIIRKRIVRKKMEYLVKWKDTWMLRDDLNDNWPSLIVNFDNAEQQKQHQHLKEQVLNQGQEHELDLQQHQTHQKSDINANHTEPAKRANLKRKRFEDANDKNEAKYPTKRSRTERMQEDVDDDDNDENRLQIIVDDAEIKKILARGTFHGEEMFRFERLNGNGYAVIPIKVANMKYPKAVIDFYESHIVYHP